MPINNDLLDISDKDKQFKSVKTLKTTKSSAPDLATETLRNQRILKQFNN